MGNKEIIDTLPTPAQYLNKLNIVISSSTNRADREQARTEREWMVKNGLAIRHAIRPMFDRMQEGYTYIAVRGAKWD